MFVDRGEYFVAGAGDALVPLRLNVVQIQTDHLREGAELGEIRRAPEVLNNGQIIAGFPHKFANIRFKTGKTIEQRRAVADQPQQVADSSSDRAFGMVRQPYGAGTPHFSGRYS